jgi:hypothetical protein
MSKLAELLKQKSTAATSATPATPATSESESSRSSNFSRGVYRKPQFDPDDGLRLLAGDDWPEISADPAQLEAFKAAAETIELIQNGVIPEHYTAITDCRRCGTVPIFPGCPSRVEGCPWCFSRSRAPSYPGGSTPGPDCLPSPD